MTDLSKTGRVLADPSMSGTPVWAWFEIAPGVFDLAVNWDDVRLTYWSKDNPPGPAFSEEWIVQNIGSVRDVTEMFREVEPEYIYRVVNKNGTLRHTGGYKGKQHTYKKQHVAQTVATRQGGKVQRSVVHWEDVDRKESGA